MSTASPANHSHLGCARRPVLISQGSSAPYCDELASYREGTSHTVANIKSQKKRNITNEKARQRNRAVKSEIKTAVHKVDQAVEAGDAEAATAAAQDASRLFDRAASKGVIHKNTAANHKSGVTKKAASVEG